MIGTFSTNNTIAMDGWIDCFCRRRSGEGYEEITRSRSPRLVPPLAQQQTHARIRTHLLLYRHHRRRRRRLSYPFHISGLTDNSVCINGTSLAVIRPSSTHLRGSRFIHKSLFPTRSASARFMLRLPQQIEGVWSREGIRDR